MTTADHLDARPAPAGRRAGTRARFEQRRSEVVDVSARLFAERGYRNTSIDDLVEATGLQRGGLYHYIDSKQQLLLLIHEELIEPLLLQAEEIVASELDPESGCASCCAPGSPTWRPTATTWSCSTRSAA